MTRVLILAFTLVFTGAAQSTRTVSANGTATIMVDPDQASLDIGVVTSAATAQDSTSQNAAATTAVISALKGVLNGMGTVETASYSVSPRYSPNSSTINGYTTSNTLRVTTLDLSIIGKLIDAANSAGANTVGGLNFGLKDSDPATQQALTAATKKALANAGAIAAGLGAKVGSVVSAQEGSYSTPYITGAIALAPAATTPIQTGTVSVSATVTLLVQLQ